MNDVLKWTQPYVREGKHTPQQASDGADPQPRHDAWRTDEEFGRQFVAGQHPMMLTAAHALPEGCTITAQDVERGAR